MADAGIEAVVARSETGIASIEVLVPRGEVRVTGDEAADAGSEMVSVRSEASDGEGETEISDGCVGFESLPETTAVLERSNSA